MLLLLHPHLESHRLRPSISLCNEPALAQRSKHSTHTCVRVCESKCVCVFLGHEALTACCSGYNDASKMRMALIPCHLQVGKNRKEPGDTFRPDPKPLLERVPLVT